MNRLFYLMHRETIVTAVEFTETGQLAGYDPQIAAPELLPVGAVRNGKINLETWWRQRAVPVTQSGIQNILEENGYHFPSEMLIRNLGLSLTDHYWIRPVDAVLKWSDVNLFHHNFGKLYFIPEDYTAPVGAISDFNPNATLGGALQKSWMISNGRRQLLKGNSRYLSAESINEVFASSLHEMQGFREYVPYSLVRIKNQKYDYGCLCNCFTDDSTELITANELLDKVSTRRTGQEYETFLNECTTGGLSEDYVRSFMSYLFLSDFVMSNLDRHGNNIGILRDTSTLQFKSMAPIYDTGRSFFAEDAVISEKSALKNLEPNSRFGTSEYALLSLVTDWDSFHIEKLPSADLLRHLYEMDSKADPSRTEKICMAYENKIQLLKEFYEIKRETKV